MLQAYSNINEMIKALEDCFTAGQKVVDGWQENSYWVLVVANLTKSGRDGNYYNTFRVKLKMPI